MPNGRSSVTILVLVEYSLQSKEQIAADKSRKGHNPCFSRILFAIMVLSEIKDMVKKSQSLF